MSKNNTRQLILLKGAEIMHIKGFNSTGIKDITDAANVPKGSFYFYFESKDYFGIELINYYSEFLFSDLIECLNTENVNYLERLKNFFYIHSEKFIKNEFFGGCPIGNFTIELADTKELFREALKLTFQNVIFQITECMQKAIDNNEIGDEIKPENLAQFIFSSWEGTIMQMRLSKNRNALNNFMDIIFDKLLLPNK